MSGKGNISHYIYEINLLCGSFAGKYYVGKRTTPYNPYTESYAGSGRIIQDYFKKYGKIEGVTYDKVILEFNNSKEENSKREMEIIGDTWKSDPKCINLESGGSGSGKHNPQNNGRQIEVFQYSLDGTLLKKWNSAKEAGNALSIPSTHITKCCKQKLHTAYGFIWRYEQENVLPYKRTAWNKGIKRKH